MNQNYTEAHLLTLEEYPQAKTLYNIGLTHPEAIIDPTPKQLLGQWTSVFPDQTIMAVDSVLGVIKQSKENYPIILNVDLDEVVRGSFKDVLGLFGEKIENQTDQIGYGTKSLNIAPEESSQQFVTTILTGMMIDGYIRPVDGIEEINERLTDIKNMGAFIIANTSTLSGCEPGTIRFLKQHFGDLFDGLLLPRNHHGLGKTTKGQAMEAVDYHLGESTIYSGTIDDTRHHILGLRESANSMRTDHVDVSPRYPWSPVNQKLTPPYLMMNYVDTPLEAFEDICTRLDDTMRSIKV